jgi:hypothetical protein
MTSHVWQIEILDGFLWRWFVVEFRKLSDEILHFPFCHQCLVYFVELASNVYWLFLTIDGFLAARQTIMYVLNLSQIIVTFFSLAFSYQQCFTKVLYFTIDQIYSDNTCSG